MTYKAKCKLGDNILQMMKQSKITDREDIRAETLYFLTDEAKPTLSEDERVILRNIKIHDCSKVYSLKITRARDNDLWLKVEGKSNKIKCSGIFIDINGSIPIDQYSHLFQFIKEGEEYSIKELLDND